MIVVRTMVSQAYAVQEFDAVIVSYAPIMVL